MEQNVKQLIRNAFQKVIEDPNANENVIRQFFSEDYVQHVDGKILNLSDFIQHIHSLKERIQDITIEFEQLISDDDKACSVHIARGTKENGEKVETKVIAFFQVKEGKISLCDELSHILHGKDEDKDLGFCK